MDLGVFQAHGTSLGPLALSTAAEAEADGKLAKRNNGAGLTEVY